MERFWNWVCSVVPLWRITLAVIMILLTISVFSIGFVESGSESYYITLFNFVVLGILLTGNVSILYQCKKGREKELEQAKDLETFEGE
ncbi:hypothetical protein [Natronoglomus mannanivorans]|uniref:Uncharacterized protein n=1 Tax=Natronoglomus mannanivorans TaxID=2979990 RepID=A0AAP3E2N9_9EURY|nr:hypothetical protein [Halobacteria archaeon AArc-xg1-1]